MLTLTRKMSDLFLKVDKLMQATVTSGPNCSSASLVCEGRPELDSDAVCMCPAYAPVPPSPCLVRAARSGTSKMSTASSYLSPLLGLIRQYPIPILLSLVIFNFLWNKFHQPGLTSIPGPPLAAYSRLWRVAHVWKGSAHLEALLYHDKYGPIVRIGPKHVSIADPKYIPTIYSIKQDYTKVRVPSCMFIYS